MLTCQDPEPDCEAACALCGDGVCDPVESRFLCPGDCDLGAPLCGDFVCGAGEDASSCPGDCGP